MLRNELRIDVFRLSSEQGRAENTVQAGFMPVEKGSSMQIRVMPQTLFLMGVLQNSFRREV